MANVLDEFLLVFRPSINVDGFQKLNSLIVRLFSNFNQLAGNSQKLNIVNDRIKTLNTTLRETRHNASSLKTLNRAIISTEKSARRINKTIAPMGVTKTQSSTKGQDGIFSPRNMLRAFVGYDIYNIGREALGGLVSATQEMGAFRSRFYAITKDEAKANEQLQFAFNLADKLALNMKSVAESYSIFYAATAKSMGDKNAQQVFKDWSEVSRVLHLTDYQFERVTYALREMASKGAIYSQDLRMQIGTHVPNAMGIAEKAANELGFAGTDWFDKFQKAGKGNQKLINEFIVLFSKYAKLTLADADAVAKALKQPDAQIVRLKQQWDKFRYAFADAGFTEDLMTVLYHINNILDKIVKHAPEIRQLIKWSLILFTGIKGAKWLYKIFDLKHVIPLLKEMGALKGFAHIIQTWGKVGMARLTPFLSFLTNPYVLTGVLIIALGAVFVWLLKTQFPNVWMTIMDYFELLKLEVEIWLLNLQTHPLFKMLSRLFNATPEETKIKSDVQDFRASGGFYGNTKYKTTHDLLSATLKDIQMHGGYFNNDKYGNFWQVNKTIGDISRIQAQRNNPVAWLGMNKAMQVEVIVNHNIKSDGTVDVESATNALKDTNFGITGAVKNSFKRIFGK